MRTVLLWLVALSVAAGALAACQAKPSPTPGPLQPPAVSLVGVSLADTGPLVPDPDNLKKYAQAVPKDPEAALKTFAGTAPATTIVLEARFKIRNPNAYPITIDRMDYRYVVDSQTVKSIVSDQVLNFKGISDPLYIPANGEVSFNAASPVRFSTLLGERVLQRGLTPADAIADSLKVWLGIQKGTLTFTLPGSAAVSSAGGNTTVNFRFTFKP